MSYSSEVLADSPAEYYRLGEASGNPADSSGNGRTGTLTGSPGRVAGLLVGDSNGAFDWDGSTTWCDIPNIGGQTAITAEALISLDGNNKAQNILARANESAGTNLQFILRVNASNKVEMSAYKGGAWVTATGTTTLSLSTTYHVAGTADGSSVKVYVNGALENTTTNAGALQSITNLGGLIAAGYNGAIYAKFDGKIDEAAIYPSALSQSRISAHYSAATGSSAASGTASLSLSASGGAAASGGGSGSLSLSASGGATGAAAGTGSLSLSASGGIIPPSPASGSASLSLSASGGVTASPAGTASLDLVATGTALAVLAASGSATLTLSASGSAVMSAGGTATLTLSAGGVAIAVFETDLSNALDGLDLLLTATVVYAVPVAAAPAGLAERYDVAIPYPPPVMVNGRPT